MRFSRKARNEFTINIISFAVIVVVASGIVLLGYLTKDPFMTVGGMAIYGVSFLIPLLAVTQLQLAAMRMIRKKQKKQSDKTNTNESK